MMDGHCILHLQFGKMKNQLLIHRAIPFLFFFVCFFFHQAQAQKIEHVILVGADGLGAYAFPDAEMPHLKKMMENGSYTLKARAVLPSSSAVNWASMLMGSGPTMHGYTEWGSKTPEIPSAVLSPYGKYPSVFSLIREQKPSFTSAAVFSWSGIGYILEEEAIDFFHDGNGDEEGCVEEVSRLIREEKPNFLFLHLDEPDGVGHGIGHNTPEYYEELKNVDRRIGSVIQAVIDAGIEDKTVVLVTSDHGGIEKGHGGKSLEEVLIPWIITGPGIRKGHEIKDLVMTFDTGATIAWLLGLEMPEAWRGKPVMEIGE